MAYQEVITQGLTQFTEFQANPIAKLLLLTALIAVYAIFIFYFYRFLAKKNLIELNLNKYNTYQAGAIFKIIAVIFYIIEYIIILPIITFFWFTVLTILIFLLAEGLELQTVILISAALIASVRVTSYISENLSQDLAKMLPFTLLGVALTRPTFFDFSTHLARIQEIPNLFTSIITYLGFIIIIELIMRFYDLIKAATNESKALKNSEEENEEQKAEEQP
jgi:hypothetical protein